MFIKDKKIVDGKMEISLKGNLNISTADMFQKELEKDLDNVTQVRLDMEEVDYVSSAGLRVLLYVCHKLEDKEGLILSHVREDVKDVMELTGFSKILNIEQ